MKILLIEDDTSKAHDIESFLYESFSECKIDVAKSYHSGVRMASVINYDIMLVDMTLPKYDGEKSWSDKSLANGGEILISAVLDMGYVVNSIVITQYDTFKDETINTIDQRLNIDCPESYKGYIKYDTASESWKSNLIKKIKYVINTNN